MSKNRQFIRDVEVWADAVQLDLVTVIGKIGLDCFAGVLTRSRVDTGRFRGSWRINVGSVDPSNLGVDEEPSTPGEGAPPGGAELSYASGVIEQVKLGDTLHISNSLPYAIVLDEKDNIVGETVAEVVQLLDAAVKEVRSTK